MRQHFRGDPFAVVRACCVVFLLCSFLAMVFYPGGHYLDRSAGQYAFFHNFLSDLGRTKAYNGQSLQLSNALFLLAVMGAGVGMGVFFYAFPLALGSFSGRAVVRWLSAWFGAAAGGCFIAVALAPADTLLELHYTAVNWAFRNYLLGVAVLTCGIYLDSTKPRKAAAAFLVFTACVSAYLWLLTNGPSPSNPVGLMIQATGQKAIVYASLATLYIQSWRAQRWLGQQRENARARTVMG